MVSQEWATNIALETEDGTLLHHKVMVDYDNLLVRCRACHSEKHKVKDYKEGQKNPKIYRIGERGGHHIHFMYFTNKSEAKDP